MPVYNSKTLEERKIFFIHDQRAHPNDVEKVMGELKKCQGQIGLNAQNIIRKDIFYPPHAHKEGQKLDQSIR